MTVSAVAPLWLTLLGFAGAFYPGHLAFDALDHCSRVRVAVVLAPVAGVKLAEVAKPDRAKRAIHSSATEAKGIRRRGERV